MKKLLLFLLFFCFVLNVEAISIGTKSITFDKEVKTNSKFIATVNINYNELFKDSTDTYGILGILYEIIYDEDILDITDVADNGWKNEAYVDSNNKRKYVLSTITENINNKCIDNTLYCGNYNLKLTFYIKNTDQKETKIKLGRIVTYIYKVNEEYNENNIDEIYEDNIISFPLTIIKNSDSSKKEEPKSIVEEKTKPNEKIVVTTKKKSDNTTNKTTTTTKVVEPNKDNNNALLKDINIKDYNLRFKKYQYEYTLIINKDVNNLSITVTPDDELAKYEIKGADDLKKNNYKVLIGVTAQNGDKKEYIINAKFKENNKILAKLKKTYEDNKKILLATGGILILLLTLIIIIKVRYNHKLDKALDHL